MVPLPRFAGEDNGVKAKMDFPAYMYCVAASLAAAAHPTASC
jgi:hypothetical protein